MNPPNTEARVHLDVDQLRMVRDMCKERLESCANWMESAIECGDQEYGKSGKTGNVVAAELAVKRRATREVFAKMNKAITALTGKYE